MYLLFAIFVQLYFGKSWIRILRLQNQIKITTFFPKMKINAKRVVTIYITIFCYWTNKQKLLFFFQTFVV